MNFPTCNVSQPDEMERQELRKIYTSCFDLAAIFLAIISPFTESSVVAGRKQQQQWTMKSQNITFLLHSALCSVALPSISSRVHWEKSNSSSFSLFFCLFISSTLLLVGASCCHAVCVMMSFRPEDSQHEQQHRGRRRRLGGGRIPTTNEQTKHNRQKKNA